MTLPVVCPGCGATFQDEIRVLRHMNHPAKSLCRDFFLRHPYPPPYHLLSNSQTQTTNLADVESLHNQHCDAESTSTVDNSNVGVTVEGLPGGSRASSTEFYPLQTGTTYGRGIDFLSRFDSDIYANKRSNGYPWYPFASKGEWELASWLTRSSGLSMASIDRFLNTELIQHLNLSFKNAKMLRSRIEMLPQGPPWKAQEITINGYFTEEPIILHYREAFSCLKMLLCNPSLEGHIDFIPKRVYDSSSQRQFGEWMTSDGAWAMQSSIPSGGTLIGTVLSSDKTTIANVGGRMAHPLLLTAANIHMDFRLKASHHTLLLTALIPCVKFIGVTKDIHTALESRLFHRCLDIVCATLKSAARNGEWMTDPAGSRRYCYTPLVSYIADTPEAAVIACVGGGGKTSHLTMAYYRQYGDPYRHEPRTASTTLAQIQVLAKDIDPWNLKAYLTQARKRFRLNAVHNPFWRDWVLPDGLPPNPSQFLTLEILHQFHKFIWDHVIKWCIKALGGPEINFRYSVLQPRNGFRHFKSGIANLKKVQGREHRDIQRYIVGVILGAVPKEFVLCVRSVIDLCYIAQLRVLNTHDLKDIKTALKHFHDNKQVILDAGLRVGSKNNPLHHFQIPKLELLQSVEPSVPLTGAIIQWSADATERAHIVVIKNPIKHTNNRQQARQICRFLDREEKCRCFDLATSIREAQQQRLVSPHSTRLEDDLSNPSSPNAIEMLQVDGPSRNIRNLFSDASALEVLSQSQPVLRPLRTFSTQFTAFHLNVSPNIEKISIDDVSTLFQIPDLRPALIEFLKHYFHNQEARSIGGRRQRHGIDFLPFEDAAVWFSVQVQTKACGGSPNIIPPQKLFAMPSTSDWPSGRKDTALFCEDFINCPDKPAVGLQGFSVAQVQLIFHPHWHVQTQIPLYLVYVHRFDIVSQPRIIGGSRQSGRFPDPISGMYVLKHSLRSDQSRMGDVVALSHCRIPVHLIPRFGRKADCHLTAQNSMLHSTAFSLNHYLDKDNFQYFRESCTHLR